MTSLTLLTQHDCQWCESTRQILTELSSEFDLEVEEIDVDSEQGRSLAKQHRVLFTPGVIADNRLIAHGRPSKRALRRDLSRIPMSS